jgi:hypothetical protein
MANIVARTIAAHHRLRRRRYLRRSQRQPSIVD